MPRRHHVVIVAQNPALAKALLNWLGDAGYELTIATTFAAGKALIDRAPALIISELKLGEYNGLHLALKAGAVGVPAIVIGPSDKVLERDADDLGVTYISSVLRRQPFLDLIDNRLRSTMGPLTRPAHAWRAEAETATPRHPAFKWTVLH